MLGGDLNVMLLCYGYIISLIVVSSRLEKVGLPVKINRKFLHVMIGNLPFIIPFFTWRLAPFLVASPFIFVTFLASPISPFIRIRDGMKGLANLSEEGHHTGLILYSISFSILALLFPDQPYIIASGILPMAYGDSTAAIIGEKFGKHKLRGNKTLVGSVAMFTVCLLALVLSLYYFGRLYSFNPTSRILAAVATASVGTLVELYTPKGYDNITVPLLGAATFIIMGGI